MIGREGEASMRAADAFAVLFRLAWRAIAGRISRRDRSHRLLTLIALFSPGLPGLSDEAFHQSSHPGTFPPALQSEKPQGPHPSPAFRPRLDQGRSGIVRKEATPDSATRPVSTEREKNLKRGARPGKRSPDRAGDADARTCS